MGTKSFRGALLALPILVSLTLAASASASTDLGAPTNTAPITGAATAARSSPNPPTLVGVRVGRHDAYDRTVFDFTGGTPAYEVQYGELYAEGTGALIPLAGAAHLHITFRGAFAYDINTGASTIDLSQVINPGFPTLRQIKFGGAFEGVVTAGEGLQHRVGFRVLRLTDPPRIAVDVAH